MASVELYEGMNPQVVWYFEHGTPSSFEAGDLVKVATDGYIQIATTVSDILGIAREKYTGSTTHKVPVELINPNSIYVVRYSGTPTRALVGDEAGFNALTKAAHTITATETGLYIVGLDPRDGDTGIASHRMLVRFSVGSTDQPWAFPSTTAAS